MSWAAVAAGGGALVSGIMGSGAAKRAGREQAAAMREAVALQREMYNTTRKDLEQYRNVGGKYTTELDQAMPELTKSFTMSDFNKDPGYDFRMQEGAKALERSAAARGGLMGGAAGKAMARYGQDYASNEYSNAYNRFNQDRDQRFNKLSNLSNMGMNAANMTGQYGQNMADQAGKMMMDNGNAQAASTIAQSNAWSDAIGQGLGAAASYFGKPTTTSESSNMSQMIKQSGSTNQQTPVFGFSYYKK
jgi:hypothetical protein